MSRKYDWPVLIAEQAESGLTQAEFCRRRGIDPRYFSQRKGQLRRAGQKPRHSSGRAVAKKAPAGFVRARPAAGTGAMLELRIAAGVLRFGADTDPGYVAKLVAALS